MRPALCGLALACALAAAPASAKEFFIGGPVHTHDMEIVANYLVGIEMAPMTAGMEHGEDVIHVEADVHATAENAFGFPDGAWIPMLTIGYDLEKLDNDWRRTGTLRAMTAKDGPHYAWNVKMGGAGRYRLTYHIASPEAQGFLHHVDSKTGVPDWWPPFDQTFTFTYPQP